MNGLALARRFYAECVRPVLPPDLVHTAARIGSGSEVLGLDDERSRDHDWGCRLQIFVDEPGELDALLERELPDRFLDHPVRFATTWDDRVRQRVEVVTVAQFTRDRLGVDATRELATHEWLSLTGQCVLEVVGGEVFADPTGELTRVRERLRWYPDDLWRYVVAAGWERVAQELPIVGRAADRGDDLGSRVITARVARGIMHLAFLLERVWPPYSKWLGTAYRALPTYVPALERALIASSWRRREDALVEAIEGLFARQAAVGLAVSERAVTQFFDRPYRGTAFVGEAVHASIVDPVIRALPYGIGSIEQWADNVDVLTDAKLRQLLTAGVFPR